MRVLSMWQPWASLLMCGAKCYETRSWRTHYRGPILIHAAKRRPDPPAVHNADWAVLVVGRLRGRFLEGFDGLPLGAILGEVELVDCVRTEDLTREAAFNDLLDERHFGDFSPGRWAWVITNRCPWGAKGFPYRGQRGLFTVQDQGLEAWARRYR